MIYLDTSVALAMLLAEDRKPPRRLWAGTLISSRLLQYEVWTRIHARGLARTHGAPASAMLGRVSMVELTEPVLRRALEPFSVPTRTLDALHLATASYIAAHREPLEFASFDGRMREAARALGLRLAF